MTDHLGWPGFSFDVIKVTCQIYVFYKTRLFFSEPKTTESLFGLRVLHQRKQRLERFLTHLGWISLRITIRTLIWEKKKKKHLISSKSKYQISPGCGHFCSTDKHPNGAFSDILDLDDINNQCLKSIIYVHALDLSIHPSISNIVLEKKICLSEHNINQLNFSRCSLCLQYIGIIRLN